MKNEVTVTVEPSPVTIQVDRRTAKALMSLLGATSARSRRDVVTTTSPVRCLSYDDANLTDLYSALNDAL